MAMAFQQPFVWRNDIFPCAVEISFLHTKRCGNVLFIVELYQIKNQKWTKYDLKMYKTVIFFNCLSYKTVYLLYWS